MIELKNISKTFGAGTVNETRLFTDFSLKVETGSFVSVVGSNGSGKTTMLNLISGTIPIDSGRILICGDDVTALPEYKRARRIARVFQDPSMGTVPSMTIMENLSIAENKGRTYGLSFAVNRTERERYRELVSQIGLGLEDKMDIPVGSLSGGQRQALSLLMATMTPMDLLLLDEHTAALDPGTADKVLELTKKIVAENHLTCLMITHNMHDALALGNRTLMMDHGHIVLDIGGEERAHTTVDGLLDRFAENVGHALDNDRILLSKEK